MTADTNADSRIAKRLFALVSRVVEIMLLKIPVSNALAGQRQAQPAPWLRQATRDGGASDGMRVSAAHADNHDAASVFDHLQTKSMPLCEEEQRLR